MTTRLSTGLAEKLLGPQSFDSIFADGCIEIRTGAQPDSADLAPTGSLIARVTRDGGDWAAGSTANGLRFVRTGRFAMKPYDATWLLKGSATGTAGWFRLLPNASDAGGYSLTAPRLDGAIRLDGASGDGQMVLITTSISPATAIPISNWWFALPPIGA